MLVQKGKNLENLELTAIASNDYRAFIRAPLAAKLLNRSLEEVNSWAKKKNFGIAKATAYNTNLTTGTWFDLAEILVLAQNLETAIECSFVFRPIDPTKG